MLNTLDLRNIPDLNKMKVFYAVYTYRSILKAAGALNITRSAVSQSIKGLETELKFKLFFRDSKRVQPTEPGEVLFRTFAPVLHGLQEALRTLETGRTDPIGHLRIGAPQDFAVSQLTPVIVEFRKRFPMVTFELILAIPDKLLGLLVDGKLDMAFADNGDVFAKNYPVSILTVMKETFVLVCSKGYFRAHLPHAKVRFEQLNKIDFVDYLHSAPVAKMWIKHHFAKSLPELAVSFSAESVHAVIKAIQGGLGAGVVPEQMIASEIRSERLKVLLGPGPEMINQITLARLLEKPVTAREKAFVDFYRQHRNN